jgi:hypothetical protein
MSTRWIPLFFILASMVPACSSDSEGAPSPVPGQDAQVDTFQAQDASTDTGQPPSDAPADLTVDTPAQNDAPVDAASGDGSVQDGSLPPVCREIHCCVLATCALSQVYDCLDGCTEGVATYWSTLYTVWWANTLCAVNCKADPNCKSKSVCDVCSSACGSDIDNVGVNSTCTTCVLNHVSSDSCPGIAEALQVGCGG